MLAPRPTGSDGYPIGRSCWLLPPFPGTNHVGAPGTRVVAHLKIRNLTRGDPRTGIKGTRAGATLSPTRDPCTASTAVRHDSAVVCELHSRYSHRWWRVAHSSVATVTAGDGTTRSGRQVGRQRRAPSSCALNISWRPGPSCKRPSFAAATCAPSHSPRPRSRLTGFTCCCTTCSGDAPCTPAAPASQPCKPATVLDGLKLPLLLLLASRRGLLPKNMRRTRALTPASARFLPMRQKKR